MFKKKKTSVKRELSFDYYMESEHPVLTKMAGCFSQRASSAYIDSTAVRLPDAVYRSSTFSNVRLRSEDYLLNYKPSRMEIGATSGVHAYSEFDKRACLEVSSTKDDELFDKYNGIELPQYLKLKKSFDLAVRSRRSRRDMSGEPMELEQLSTLLYYANGVTGKHPGIDPKVDQWPHEALGSPNGRAVRATGSGGGLYPIYLFLLVQKVNGLDDGLYRYLPERHGLATLPLSAEQWAIHKEDIPFWGNNISADNINVCIFYVYDLYRNSRKYGDTGLSLALIETGMIAGHVHLAATAMDLASCCLAGSNKSNREKFLGIDGLSQHYVHLTAVGRPG